MNKVKVCHDYCDDVQAACTREQWKPGRESCYWIHFFVAVESLGD